MRYRAPLQVLAFTAVCVGLFVGAAEAGPIKPLTATSGAPAPTIETLDCTLGCDNVLFGGAVWSTFNTFHPSGTGVFEPFLRLQANGNATTEDGHNTDAPKQDYLNDEKGGIWTHAVPLWRVTPGTLPGFGNQMFYAFALDTGEPANYPKSLLSLDALKLCTSNSATELKADDCPTTPYDYDLDSGTNREVLLDYRLNGSGNGRSDLFVYVPVFSTTDEYLYLYSHHGAKGGGYAVDGTFSEWSFFDEPAAPPPPPPVPEPASMLLLGTGLVGVMRAARKRSR